MRKEDIRNVFETVIGGEPPDIDYIQYLDVGTNKFLEFFDDELLNGLIIPGGATCRFFEGPYGSGKSHLLKMLSRVGLKRNMLVSQIIELSEAASLRNWHMMTSYILKHLEVNDNGKVVKGLPDILAMLGAENRIDSNKLKQFQFSHPGFANAMGKAIQADTLKELQRELLFGFLYGEKIGAMKLREVGIRGVKNPLTRRNAELVLNTVLSGLFSLGLPVMLLIDETETALGNSYAAKNQMAANLIRRLIDACNTGTIIGSMIVFGVLPGFIENCGMTYQAVGERLIPPNLSDMRFGWRWPVLSLENISMVRNRDKFLEECVTKHQQFINLGSGNTKRLSEQLLKVGREVLHQNAGISFRRELMKRFASIALERLR